MWPLLVASYVAHAIVVCLMSFQIPSRRPNPYPILGLVILAVLANLLAYQALLRRYGDFETVWYNLLGLVAPLSFVAGGMIAFGGYNWLGSRSQTILSLGALVGLCIAQAIAS